MIQKVNHLSFVGIGLLAVVLAFSSCSEKDDAPDGYVPGEFGYKSLDEGEFAARIGGDEYSAVILLKNGKSIDEFRNRVYANVKRKASDFKNYPIGVSVGIAEVKSYRTIVEAMKLADEEMYKEKQLHHGTRD